MALDRAGNIFLVGSTSSIDFPLMNPFQDTLATFVDPDAFVVRVSPLLIDLRISAEMLSWRGPADALAFDVVQGDLLLLHDTQGNYEISTDHCVVNDHPESVIPEAAVPSPGEGFWFLVRTESPFGKGIYDAGDLAQVGMRDEEIMASLNDCP